jgi:hypothetical protein
VLGGDVRVLHDVLEVCVQRHLRRGPRRGPVARIRPGN